LALTQGECSANGHLRCANVLPSAWEEIIEVFGDGHDYDWALEGDEDPVEHMEDEEAPKPDMKYTDVSIGSSSS
jgi:hypothetical protein